jgi:hypothetical protein
MTAEDYGKSITWKEGMILSSGGVPIEYTHGDEDKDEDECESL